MNDAIKIDNTSNSENANTDQKEPHRIRRTQSHERLKEAVESLQALLEKAVGYNVPIELNRAQGHRYARALFDLRIGKNKVENSTVEELLAVMNGVRMMHDVTATDQRRERMLAARRERERENKDQRVSRRQKKDQAPEEKNDAE